MRGQVLLRADYYTAAQQVLNPECVGRNPMCAAPQVLLRADYYTAAQQPPAAPGGSLGAGESVRLDYAAFASESLQSQWGEG